MIWGLLTNLNGVFWIIETRARLGSFFEPSLRAERCFDIFEFSNAWGEIELEFSGPCVVMKGPKVSASPEFSWNFSVELKNEKKCFFAEFFMR